MPVGPLAELALNRVMLQSLRAQVADAQAIADRRARDASAAGFALGERHGRAAWPVALILGALSGATVTGLCFVLFG